MKKVVNIFIVFCCMCTFMGCGGNSAEEVIKEEPVAEEVAVEEAVAEEEASSTDEIPVFSSVAELYDQYDNWLGETIAVEGYFGDDNPSLLVDDLDDFLRNSLIPIETMLILEQDVILPQESGAYIKVTGTLRIYEDEYQRIVADLEEREILILYVEDYEIIEPSQLNIPDSDEVETPDEIVYEARAERDCIWALIISGSNENRYWNDVLFTYKTAVGLGAQWVQVLFANGAAPPAFFGRLPGMIPAVDLLAATRWNFWCSLAYIEKYIPADCELWIITTDHGVGWEPPNLVGFGPGNNYLRSGLGRIDGAPADRVVPEGDLFPFDENQPAVTGVGNSVNADNGDDVDEGLILSGSILYDDSFRDEISNMNAALAERGVAIDIYVMMEQCFSGGFVADFTIPWREVTHIATAASEDQASWSMGWPVFDEFLYYFISALNGADPWGRPYPAAPFAVDSNANGTVEWNEAFDYAEFMDSKAEDPQFD